MQHKIMPRRLLSRTRATGNRPFFRKLRVHPAFTLSFVLGALLYSNPCSALEKPKVFRGSLVLEGIIQPGDYSIVFNFLRDESNFKKISGGVFLASPGGYVYEAMKIGNLIRELRLRTDDPSNPSPQKRDFGAPIIQAS